MEIKVSMYVKDSYSSGYVHEIVSEEEIFELVRNRIKENYSYTDVEDIEFKYEAIDGIDY